ncbi:MAG: immunity 17 family protein [Ectothiorhodospiraceae bacterium]|nr:immunity 17 family protein [Chromatiales bacterium]MCP5157656.1 immunity 17 family protein [Ectothiorhodospiraceae bacterium]
MVLNLQGLLAAVIGVMTCVAAVLDWNWFMENYRARFFVRVLGRRGARVLYFCLGVTILALVPWICEFRPLPTVP